MGIIIHRVVVILLQTGSTMYCQFSTYSYIINSSVVSKKELNWKQLRRQFLRVGCSAEVDSVVQEAWRKIHIKGIIGRISPEFENLLRSMNYHDASSLWKKRCEKKSLKLFHRLFC